MIILGIPLLFYLIGFSIVCMASRWWILLPVSAGVMLLGMWIRDAVWADTGFGADTARSFLTLAAIGCLTGFTTRAILLATGWSARNGRGRDLTIAMLVSAPAAYGIWAAYG